MTSFSIDEHSSMNNTIPTLNPADTTPQISSTLPPVNVVPTSVAATKVNDNNTSTNNDENETEISDTNITQTNSSSSPIKEKDNKERDDLKEKMKAEKKAAKKLMKEMAICKVILEEMEVSFFNFSFRVNSFSNGIFSLGSRRFLAILAASEHQTISHVQEGH